jgi:hypothetical protein
MSRDHTGCPVPNLDVCAKVRSSFPTEGRAGTIFRQQRAAVKPVDSGVVRQFSGRVGTVSVERRDPRSSLNVAQRYVTFTRSGT